MRHRMRRWSQVLAAALVLAVNAAGVVRAQTSPLVIARQGYFFVGGTYFGAPDGRSMSGQMYVEFQIPAAQTHPYPLVMFSGGGQSGLNYTGTPDGREGWMQYFLRQGYAVYVLDQPSRARSPHQAEVGPQSRGSTNRVEQRFTAPERSKLWPQAGLHTQWPGTGIAGDPVFDQFYAQNFPSLTSFPRQQELNRDAGAALLDRIGPAILLTHSQSGTFGWLVADARPALVKGIVALEPSGPPVHDNVEKGAPDWFADGPLTKPYGLTAQPLTYDPPITAPSGLTFVRQDSPDAPGLVRCWAQATPARRLVHLQRMPILVVQSEASYHAAYDHCTVAYLRQSGADALRYVRLADEGIKGNGHMFMLEKNSVDIAALIARWLKDAVESAQGQPLRNTPRITGHPDFNGIWQAINTAYWNLEAHSAEALNEFWQLGAMAAIPAGRSVVRDGTIPYRPEALAKRNDNRAKWPAADPEAKCYMLGVPRVTYHNMPFQIFQGEGDLLMVYPFAAANRVIYMTDRSELPVDSWMGKSDGAWDGDVLVITTKWQNGQSWLDRAGNHASSKLTVTERFRLLDSNHIWYEATLDDPQTYTRPWTIEMPLYRQIDQQQQLLEHKCVPFADRLLYHDLIEKDSK